MDRGTPASTTTGGRSAPDGPGRRRAGRGRGATARELTAACLGLAVAAGALALLVTLARHGSGGPAGSREPGPARPDEVLLGLLTWLGGLLAGWLALGSLLAVAALLPGAGGRAAAALADRVTPVAVRKTLTLVLGASVGSLALPVAPVSGAGTGSGSGAGSGAGSVADRTVGAEGGERVDASGSGGVGPPSTPDAAHLSPGFAPTRSAAPTKGPSPSVLPARPGGLTLGPGYAPTTTTTTTTTLPAAARPSDRGPGRVDAHRAAAGPGFVPSAPPPVHDAGPARLLAPAPRATASAYDLVTVRRGDSLWAIASRHLGPGASDAEVAHEWPRWYAANRHVIGDDPDLLVPGQQLSPPEHHTPTTHPGAGSAPAGQGAGR